MKLGCETRTVWIQRKTSHVSTHRGQLHFVWTFSVPSGCRTPSPFYQYKMSNCKTCRIAWPGKAAKAKMIAIGARLWRSSKNIRFPPSSWRPADDLKCKDGLKSKMSCASANFRIQRIQSKSAAASRSCMVVVDPCCRERQKHTSKDLYDVFPYRRKRCISTKNLSLVPGSPVMAWSTPQISHYKMWEL